MAMIPDRRCSIWFPSKVHRSSQNKFAQCRINYFAALKPANLKETLCIAFEVICELALIYSLSKTTLTIITLVYNKRCIMLVIQCVTSCVLFLWLSGRGLH